MFGISAMSHVPVASVAYTTHISLLVEAASTGELESLTQYNIVPQRTAKVPAESRVLSTASYTDDSEDRVLMIPAENRVLTITTGD